MSAYETSVVIPSFAGINQSGDGYNQSMRYARVMENVNVSGGSFRPMREGYRLPQTMDKPIGTLAYLHRRFTAAEDERTVLVAISDGKVYTKLLDHDDIWVQRYSGLTEDNCDWVTYEVNERDNGFGVTVPTLASVDVLLFSNAKDGMFCLYGDNLQVSPVKTPYKFGVLARFNERIWGSGITDMPDSMVYSAPYNPFDWSANAEIPEDGGGEIMQPSWDGDSFAALRQCGSYLLAFKRNSVWRIYGTNPGEFVVQQQYGGGTVNENTVAVSYDHAYMLGAYGIMRYDGDGVTPFQQDVVKDLFGESVNHAAISAATAAMRDGVYCLALPINGSTFCNAILEYDTREYTFALRTNITVDSFLNIGERLFYTSGAEPGRVFELRDDIGLALPCVWKSGFQDLGIKSSAKSAFVLYFLVEAETAFELYITMRTEKKAKQKCVVIKPGKAMKVQMNNQGRFFQLELESYTSVPFCISGGIKIDMELDPD